ncbi:kelch-like protein 2 3 [Stylonychia lemnae]|uniref:Kelch-like protein 2 3 n=1 Tax=Stylonychia lemnae TaxID=5949 RepID=A0A078A431_STYLE|nr:kelch-like protein 2 3 [Stylonychia lemnae]|eukprot:CDW77028.1 kelch-like protein 2 3 [Stylonychia lemnae]
MQEQKPLTQRRKKKVDIQEHKNQVLEIMKDEPIQQPEQLDASHRRTKDRVKSVLKKNLDDSYESDFFNSQLRIDDGSVMILPNSDVKFHVEKRPAYKPNYLERVENDSQFAKQQQNRINLVQPAQSQSQVIMQPPPQVPDNQEGFIKAQPLEKKQELKKKLNIQIPELKLPKIDVYKQLEQAPPQSGAHSDRQSMIKSFAQPSKFSLRLSGFNTQRPTQEDDGTITKLPDLFQKNGSIFKKGPNLQIQRSFAKALNSTAPVKQTDGPKKSSMTGIQQRIERVLEESKQKKTKKIESVIINELEIRNQGEIEKKFFKGKDDDASTKDFDFQAMKETIIKNKYGIINGQLYYLDTDRDQLMKFQELIDNPYAMEKVLKERVGDQKLQGSLLKIKEAIAKNQYDNKLFTEVTKELEFYYQMKFKDKKKEIVQQKFLPETEEENQQKVTQLEKKLIDLRQSREQLAAQTERQREEELKLEIQLLEKEQEIMRKQIEERKKNAENRIKNLKRRLNIINTRFGKNRNDFTQNNGDQEFKDDDDDDEQVASKAVKKYNAVISAVRDNLNGQTAEHFIDQIEKDEGQKDIGYWMSNVAMKSPGMKQKKILNDNLSEVKAHPINKDTFDKLLDQIESRTTLMQSIINETSRGRNFTDLDPIEQCTVTIKEKQLESMFGFAQHDRTRNINLTKKNNTESDVGKPADKPYGISGVADVQTYEKVMDYYSVLPSIREKAASVICLMNEDVIFRFDLEMNFVKPYKLDKYLLFKFPSWVDCKNGTLMYTGGLRKNDSGEPVQIFAIGGFSLNKTVVKSTESYDFDKNQWTRAASMSFERTDFSVFSHESSHFIYAFGGCFDSNLNTTIERYDSLEDRWDNMQVQLKERINKFNQNVFIALDIEIFGGQSYENQIIDKRKVLKNFTLNEQDGNPEVLVYNEIKTQTGEKTKEILVIATYDKNSTLVVNNFINLTDQKQINDKDFRITNLTMRGTIWDIGYYKNGLYIIRKYSQQSYEFYNILSQKAILIVLKTDKFNPQIDQIDFSENLGDQLDALEEDLFKEQLKLRLEEKRRSVNPVGFKEDQFIQSVRQGGNSNLLTRSAVLQKQN